MPNKKTLILAALFDYACWFTLGFTMCYLITR